MSDNTMLDERVNKRRVAAAVSVIAASVTVISVVRSIKCIPRALHVNRDKERDLHIRRYIYESDIICKDQLRVTRLTFHSLCDILKEKKLLTESLNVSVEEQLVIFLHIIGHNVRYRVASIRFSRSIETIHRYFKLVLKAVLALHSNYVKQADGLTPPEVRCNSRYWPWFKDCIGALDGTHVRASTPIKMQGRFRGRKEHTTQNVLAAVSFDLKFTYVLAGWEGSAHDATILEDALTRNNGLLVPKGKYYLVDAGYGTRNGFIPPYRGVRYHLKEYTNHSPENMKELFNHRHSSLRTTVERAFGVLKKRFRVLDNEPFWSYQTQVDVVLACCTLHNFISSVNPSDLMMDEVDNVIINHEEEYRTQRRQVRQKTQREGKDENKRWTEKRDAIARDMYSDYIKYI